MRRILALVRMFGLLGLWALTVAWMIRDTLHDPYDPNRTGTSAYGHNHEGALQTGIVLTLIELAVLHLILQPGRAGAHGAGSCSRWCSSRHGRCSPG